MKSGPFIKLIADSFTVEEKTVKVYARALKEAGLLTTGARGVNAPDMTPLDAARITIALLSTESPAECVDRVKRFGPLNYDPNMKRTFRAHVAIQPKEFNSLFEGESLEQVLSYIYSLPAKLGHSDAAKWFNENVFHLRVIPFSIVAELVRDLREDGEIVGSQIVPFRGDPYDKNFPKIKGGIRTERLISAATIMGVAFSVCAPLEKRED